MPRRKIDLPTTIEYLSIVDEHGNVDTDLEPDLLDDLLLKLYRAMVLGRRLDERMLRLQRQGRMGTFAPISGQEALQIGAVAPLRESDWLVPAFRETAAEIYRGRPITSPLLMYGGYTQGGYAPPEQHNLPMTIPVATQLLHAVGISYGIKYRKQDDVAMVFFGDGATSEGEFYEALNFAGVYQTPTIFVCQNNQWAISMPRKRQTRTETLAQKAIAAGIPGIQVDGNDILAVYVVSSEAIARARGGGGPTLIEAVTYRLSVHTTADDPTRYRTDEEVAEWQARDPIVRFQGYLKNKGLLTDERIKEIDNEVDDEIRQAVEQIEAQAADLVKDPLIMFDHFYAEMPPYLQEQREELARELAEEKEASRG